jgi:hypothetical protein
VVLAKILFDDRTSHQYEGRDPEDLDILIQTVLPQTRAVPVAYLYESYVVALEMRKPGDNFQIRGVELLNGWKVIQGRVEMESNGAYDKKQLTDKTTSDSRCRRCYGTGMERMPDGSVRKGCQHEPMTAAEEDEIAANVERDADFIRTQAEFMREALSKIGSPKPAPREEAPKQDGKRLVCDACGRKVLKLYGYEPGATCGELLNRGTHEGDLKLCEGKFKAL